MSENKLWAVLDSSNTVISVECATEEWVHEWRKANEGTEISYKETRLDAKDYAGIGYSWDETRGRFMPPFPDLPGTWVYDEDAWQYIDLDAGESNGGTEEATD